MLGRSVKRLLGRGREPQPFGQTGAWVPEAFAARLVRVEATALDLDGPRRGVPKAGRRPESSRELQHEVVDAGRNAGADVVRAPPAPLVRRDHRVDNVPDVDVVALVRAVAKKGELLVPLPAADKDRDDATFEIRTLAGPVKV